MKASTENTHFPKPSTPMYMMRPHNFTLILDRGDVVIDANFVVTHVLTDDYLNIMACLVRRLPSSVTY